VVTWQPDQRHRRCPESCHQSAILKRRKPDESVTGVLNGIGSRQYIVKLNLDGTVSAFQTTGLVIGNAVPTVDGRGVLAVLLDDAGNAQLSRFDF
jgi:hypothetical protein